MPKAAKKSSCAIQNLPPEESDVPESQEESANSDLEQDANVSFHPSLVSPAHTVPQVIPSMYMPYIEGPRMGFTVNDGLYHLFLKWRLKYKNVLECELAALPEKCKKVIAWSRDFGMDQYLS